MLPLITPVLPLCSLVWCAKARILRGPSLGDRGPRSGGVPGVSRSRAERDTPERAPGGGEGNPGTLIIHTVKIAADYLDTD